MITKKMPGTSSTAHRSTQPINQWINQNTFIQLYTLQKNQR